MLGIILMLLKIIGWILLGILGLFIALAVLLLFVPIPYRVWVKGDSGDTASLVYRVKIFGLQIIPKKERKGKKGRRSKRKARKKESATADNTSVAEIVLQNETASKNRESGLEQAKPPQPTGDTTPQIQSALSSDEQMKQKKKKKRTKKESGGKDIHGALERLKAEFTDEGNRRALSHVIKEIRYLLRHFGPRRVRADVSFSLGDPANTGYVTAALSICPFSYGRDCSICPDFVTEQWYLRGWMDVRGHARIVHLLISGLRLLFDRDIRNIIRKILKKTK